MILQVKFQQTTYRCTVHNFSVYLEQSDYLFQTALYSEGNGLSLRDFCHVCLKRKGRGGMFGLGTALHCSLGITTRRSHSLISESQVMDILTETSRAFSLSRLT